MLRRSLIAVAVLAAALAVAPFAAAAVVHIRVEGKTVTLFGSTEPTRHRDDTARSAPGGVHGAAEFYYHVTASSFGNYVDQVGLYGGARRCGLGLQGQRHLAARRRRPGAVEGR